MKIDKIDPAPGNMKALATEYPQDTPVTMLNILRFKEKVDGSDEAGIDAYRRYGANAAKHLVEANGKVIFAGEIKNVVIGDSDNMAHQILLVEYPSVKHFLNMVMSPAYQAITHDRTMALEYGGLIACQKLNK